MNFKSSIQDVKDKVEAEPTELEVYLSMVAARREFIRKIRKMHDSLMPMIQLCEENRAHSNQLEIQLDQLLQSQVIHTYEYQNLQLLLADAKEVEVNNRAAVDYLQKRINDTENDLKDVETQLQAMKPNFKRGKVLHFERHRS